MIASIYRHLRGQTTSIFRITVLCLCRNWGVWGRKWVRDIGRQQAIWPVRTRQKLKGRQTSFQANRIC